MTAPFGYTVLLQARRRVSDAWADIDPAQVEALSKLGNQIRAIQTVGPAAAPAVGGEDTQDDLAGRRKRLSETVILIGKALEAGRSLASIFPLEEDALQQAKDTVAKRLALLNTACYEFKTTFHHDLAAAQPASPLRGREIEPKVIAEAFSDWAWNKKGDPIGLYLPHEAAKVAFHAGAKWASAASPEQPAADKAQCPHCERHKSERDGLYLFVNGLLGLMQLVSGRDDMPTAIGEVLRTNHRVADAAAYLTQIVPPNVSDKKALDGETGV